MSKKLILRGGIASSVIGAAVVMSTAAAGATVNLNVTGVAKFKNTVNTAAAFTVQDAAGTQLLTVNTVDKSVSVGSQLKVGGSISANGNVVTSGNLISSSFSTGLAGANVNSHISGVSGLSFTQLNNSSTAAVNGTGKVLSLDSNGNVILVVDQTGAGPATIGTLDALTKSANGASINGNAISLQTADAKNPGLVSTGTQTFAGNKNFDGTVNVSSTLSAGSITTGGINTYFWSYLNGVTNAGTTTYNPGISCTSSDHATGGSIGTSATTVDRCTYLIVNQTTAGQTLSIPTPSITSNGKIIYLSNTGTAAFTISGVTLAPNETTSFMWIGTSWSHIK